MAIALSKLKENREKQTATGVGTTPTATAGVQTAPTAPVVSEKPADTIAGRAQEINTQTPLPAPTAPTNTAQGSSAVAGTPPAERITGSEIKPFEEAMGEGYMSPAQYMIQLRNRAAAEGRELNGYEAALDMLKSQDFESPNEKAKRERRDAVGRAINGLGALIGNVANMIYTQQGAVPVDVNSAYFESNERARQIRDKQQALKQQQDAILLQARMSDIDYRRRLQAARQQAKAQQEADAAKQALDMYKFETTRRDNAAAQAAADKIKREQLRQEAEEGEKNRAVRREIGLSKSSKDQEKVGYINIDGTDIAYPKDKENAWFANLYEIMRTDPDFSGTKLDEIKLQFGEGGDISSKMKNIVLRQIQYSPSAKRWIYNQTNTPQKLSNGSGVLAPAAENSFIQGLPWSQPTTGSDDTGFSWDKLMRSGNNTTTKPKVTYE
jgi:hypothetical protein